MQTVYRLKGCNDKILIMLNNAYIKFLGIMSKNTAIKVHSLLNVNNVY